MTLASSHQLSLEIMSAQLTQLNIFSMSTFSLEHVTLSEIPSLGAKCGSHMVYYLNTAGAMAMKKILYVLLYTSPQTTFSPLLQPLTAVLLHFMGEEECFACLTGLLNSSKKSHLEQTRAAAAISDATFQDLCKLNMVRMGSIVHCRLKS